MLFAVASFGCGDATLAGLTERQADAVSAAAENTCDRYSDCEGFGPGKSFADRDACEADRTRFWDEHWPADECNDRINTDKLQFCLDAITATSCNNFFDQLNTVYGKCPRSEVCSGE